ncbi:MAG: hypothetical protein HY816_15180 [Candidatus Wallbacteria bacterium]|nr:hypothetical protein [Candidatus Wallbacteria bacterium]
MRVARILQWRAPMVLLLLVSFMGTLVPADLLAQSRYDRFIPGADRWPERNPPDGAGNARLGRTLGGVAGVAAGSFGGAALAAAVIKGAGLASMGPIVPIIVGTAITAGGAFLGSKILSSLGQEGDRMLGPGTTWALVGATAGAVLGYALIPALGPFAGPAGRIVAAGVAGLAGGILAKLFAPTLDRYATPRNIYAGAGAVIGAVGFGPIGAVAGAAGGYALGAIFGDNFFADKRSSPGDYVDDVGWEFSRTKNRFLDWKDSIGDWFHNKTGGFKDRMRDNWGYYDQDSAYYDDYRDSRRYAQDYIGYQQRPYPPAYYQDQDYRYQYDQRSRNDGFSFDLGIGYNGGGSAVSIRARHDDIYRRIQEASRRGDRRAMMEYQQQLRSLDVQYQRYR